MINIGIEITPEPDDLSADLRGVVHAAIKSGMQYLVSKLEAAAVKEIPVRTSNLVNSITSYVSPDGMSGYIKATAPYAEYVHDGTGIYHTPDPRAPWMIRPADKHALYWPGAKHPVKKITHQGSRPNQFVARTTERWNPQALFEEGISNYLKEHGE
jgi:hypothetical protein